MRRATGIADERNLECEARAAARNRPDLDFRSEQACEPPHDGKAQSEAFAAVSRSRARLEVLLEHALQMLGGDADSSVPYRDLQPLAVPSASEQHLALARVLDRVGDEIPEQALEHCR